MIRISTILITAITVCMLRTVYNLVTFDNFVSDNFATFPLEDVVHFIFLTICLLLTLELRYNKNSR